MPTPLRHSPILPIGTALQKGDRVWRHRRWTPITAARLIDDPWVLSGEQISRPLASVTATPVDQVADAVVKAAVAWRQTRASFSETDARLAAVVDAYLRANPS